MGRRRGSKTSQLALGGGATDYVGGESIDTVGRRAENSACTHRIESMDKRGRKGKRTKIVRV